MTNNKAFPPHYVAFLQACIDAANAAEIETDGSQKPSAHSLTERPRSGRLSPLRQRTPTKTPHSDRWIHNDADGIQHSALVGENQC